MRGSLRAPGSNRGRAESESKKGQGFEQEKLDVIAQQATFSRRSATQTLMIACLGTPRRLASLSNC